MNSGHVELFTGRRFSPDAGLRFLSRKMMRVLLFLVCCFCVGLSYDEEEYGSTLRLVMLRKAHFIEFTQKHNSTMRILWQRDFPLDRRDSRQKVIGFFYMLSNLTQEDSGHYVVRDSNRTPLSTKTIEVVATSRSYTRSPGESLTVTFDLEPHSCNIFFYPKGSYEETEIVLQGRLQTYSYGQDCRGFVHLKPCGILNEDLKLSCQGRFEVRDSNGNTALVVSLEMDAISRSYTRSPGESLTVTFDLEPHSCNIFFYPEGSYEETEIVLQGRLQTYSYGQDCRGFVNLKPCGILNEDLKLSCRGRFEVRDSNGNTALVVSLEMDEPEFDDSKIGIGFGVFLLIISCCTWVIQCCCGKSSSKKETSETPEAEAEPAVHYHEYDREPVGPRPEHLSPPPDTHYPAPPSYTLTDPLIHNPPMDVPPSYSEVSVPVERAEAPAVPIPIPSEPDQRFELKGMNFPSALDAGSALSDVYSSDKINSL
ncbi:uncharacterized protein [Chaetodon trifascialis]|uniref:uncharacterized protein n=1 Tax=Chaetodon trifascialis TaxID=109706 RepID=UPI003992D491